MKANLFGKKIVFYIAIILVWQAIDSADIWPDNIFPSPIEVGEDLIYGMSDGSLFYGIGTSMWRLIVGLAIAICGGMILGIFMARVETVNQTIGSLVLGLQSIPSVAWVPLAILWFGLTDAGIIFVTAIGAIFAVTINVYTGVKNIDPSYIEAHQNLALIDEANGQINVALERSSHVISLLETDLDSWSDVGGSSYYTDLKFLQDSLIEAYLQRASIYLQEGSLSLRDVDVDRLLELGVEPGRISHLR